MSRKRKAKRSFLKALLLWVGKRMLGRVQKRSLKSITERPKPKRFAVSGLMRTRKPAAPAPKPTRRMPRLRRKAALAATPSVTPAPTPAKPRRKVNRRRAGKGIAAALLTTAAVAAIKMGAERVIESEREQHVVTPDFDVFSDDDE